MRHTKFKWIFVILFVLYMFFALYVDHISCAFKSVREILAFQPVIELMNFPFDNNNNTKKWSDGNQVIDKYFTYEWQKLKLF